jgi:hypothetical protein
VILEIHDNFKTPQRLNCSRAVIRDKFNNPIAVMIETAPDIITVASVQDTNFRELLKLLGITDSVIVTSI